MLDQPGGQQPVRIPLVPLEPWGMSGSDSIGPSGLLNHPVGGA